MAGAVVVAVIVTLLLTRPGGSGTAEVFAEPAAAAGRNPVTESTADESTPSPSATPRKSAGTTSAFHGSTPGLYGGARKSASCDVDRQIGYLRSDPAKNRAVAGALGQAPNALPSYLRSLTPVRLGYDTRVTNHGYKDGRLYEFQSVLQAGTAVLIDAHGVPRMRCKCGNPLMEPKELEKGGHTRGRTWPGYQPSDAVVVLPAKKEVPEFVLRDPKTGEWFARPEGADGPAKDIPTPPPDETPSGPPSSLPPPYRETPPPDVSSTGPSGTPPTSGGTGTGPSGSTTGGSTEPPGTTTGEPPSQPGTTTGGSTEQPGTTERPSEPSGPATGSTEQSGPTTEGPGTTSESPGSGGTSPSP
ncbi:hypothetical protein ADL29_13235 [Streptomyces chattanoogensis]|uniref:DUF6777 domain-containing protein n=1 Tax=Streptomyces chattanoogensis TaxID=66876 RepID=A0A0N0H142_9ACTN|nr:hypothetical protein ADL29_13235 [Streptomyces chattanoogensis]